MMRLLSLAIALCLVSCVGLTRIATASADTAVQFRPPLISQDVDNYEAKMMRDLAEANKSWGTPDTTGVVQLTVREVLQRILPEATLYAASDSMQIFHNNIMQRRFPIMTKWQKSTSDSTVYNQHVFFEDWEAEETLTVGKFVDGRQTYAVAFSVPESLISFYRLDNGHWKEVGRRRKTLTMPFLEIYFEEMNGKPGREIVLSTWPPNTNGNTWMELFVYSAEQDSVKFAGDFSTSYTVNLRDTIVTEEYGGSWYMDQHKTLYVWHDDMLVPLRTAVLIPPENINVPGCIDTLEYYENPTLKYFDEGTEGMKLIFREPYKEKNKKHRKYWDDFFELNEDTKINTLLAALLTLQAGAEKWPDNYC